MTPGSRVLYFGSFGHAPPLPGTITGTGEEGGAVVYDVLLDSGARHWGYSEQFEPMGDVSS